MIPILLYILYKKKGKDISRAAKKMLSNAKARRMLKKAEKMSGDMPVNMRGNRRKPIRNVYRRFKNNRFNRKRARNR